MKSSYATELARLREQGLYREMRVISDSQGPKVMMQGKQVTLLCSNNYLGLADHPRLKEAAVKAVDRFGTGSGAARLVSGTLELHAMLEERLARFKRTEASLVFNSGYAANTGIISALLDRGDVVYSDRLNHASIVDGCLLSRAKFIRYPHNDMTALRRLLAAHAGAGRQLIVTDGVFSMDGDIAPLSELVRLKTEFGAMLMVDDAHGTGVLGEGGRGSAELAGVASEIDVHMGTLGKALGSFGAYAAASLDIVEYLVNRARSFIFSTSLPPPVLAASLSALDVVESEEGGRLRDRLRKNNALFRTALVDAGLDTMGSETQIVPVMVGAAGPVMEYTARLLAAGVFVQGIRPPTVPTGSCRLRCTLMATHTEEDVMQAAAAIITAGRDLGIIS